MDVFILEDINQPLAKDIIKQVHNAKGEDIDVHIMSLGGDVLAGNAIASVLKNTNSHVTTNVLGVAASMGAVISQAGNTRLIAEDAHFLIHNGGQANVGRGTKEDHLEAAETLAKLDTLMVNSFSRTGLPKKDIKAIMKLDKLFSAEEAVTLGFFDGTTKPIQATAHLTKHNDMSTLSELMGKVDTAAIKLGLRETDDEKKKALVAALETELKADMHLQEIDEENTDEATGAEILSSDMVSREEFEMFKAEMMALMQPLLGAVEELPTPDQTMELVEETTEAKLNKLLQAIKSKTVLPIAKQNFEQPNGKVPEDWSVYDARKKEILESNKR